MTLIEMSFLLTVGAVGLVLALTTIVNVLAFPRLRPAIEPRREFPRLSILIPARNEAAVIGDTVKGLLQQEGPAFELLVLDDGSRDATRERSVAAAAGDPRFRLLAGLPLPAGWLGKNWACHQLAREAQGDLLLFTDADVRWEEGALAALLAHRKATMAGLLTIWPTQITGSAAEWLVVPLMKFAIMSYLPLPAVHHLANPAFAAANGQCLLFTRGVYQAIGGHAAVRGDIVEDVALARRVKRVGEQLRMADGAGLISCRMYDGWSGVRRGFGKNILAGHGDSLVFLGLSTLFHWAVFVAPWLLLVLRPSPAAVGLVAGLTAVRWLGEWHVDRRPWRAIVRALTMLFSVGLMTLVVAQAVRWRLGGGPVWKERVAGQS